MFRWNYLRSRQHFSHSKRLETFLFACKPARSSSCQVFLNSNKLKNFKNKTEVVWKLYHGKTSKRPQRMSQRPQTHSAIFQPNKHISKIHQRLSGKHKIFRFTVASACCEFHSLLAPVFLTLNAKMLFAMLRFLKGGRRDKRHVLACDVCDVMLVVHYQIFMTWKR